MDFVALLPWAVFGLVTFVAGLLFLRSTNRQTVSDERLSQLVDPMSRVRNESVGDAFQKAASTLSKPLQSKDRVEHHRMKLQLANAGFNSPRAVECFLAVKTMSMATGALIASGTGLALFGFVTRSLYAPVIGAAFGMYLPSLVLSWLAKRRQERIFLSLPDVLDLLVICMEVGQGLDAAFRRIIRE